MGRERRWSTTNWSIVKSLEVENLLNVIGSAQECTKYFHIVFFSLSGQYKVSLKTANEDVVLEMGTFGKMAWKYNQYAKNK